MNKYGLKILTGFLAVFVFSVGPASASVTNLALSGIATQVSDLSSAYTADRAIDGIINPVTDPSPTNFTHTGLAAGAWWQVDLGNLYTITEIDIYNRVENNYRINPGKVTIFGQSNQVVWTGDITTTENFYQFMLNDPATPVIGQIVKIELVDNVRPDQNYLHMREVQVYGSPVPVPAAVWLLGSGLIGLIGIRRFRK
jgi:hypothetical protein